jgi:predicted nucleic acid-binding protein
MGASFMIALDDALSGVDRLFFDTAPIIYFVEAHPTYDAILTEIFRRTDNGALSGMTSVITLCEVLVHPFIQDNVRLQHEYHDLLLNSENFQIAPIDTDTAARAAKLRARYQLRTPDALQIAAALNMNCEAVLTNDTNLRRVTELRVIVLNDLAISPSGAIPAQP